MARKKAIRRHTGGSKKILVIISNHEFKPGFSPNIVILRDFMKQSGYEVEYAGISNSDDFKNYENIVTFKYKEVNPRKQFNKICDFITDYKENLDHDWYIKIRPDIKLLDNISFDILSTDAIHGRAREYRGRKRIKYGNSVNGEGYWKLYNGSSYVDCEDNIILDDMLYIFHKNIIQNGAFDKIPQEPRPYESEWFHSNIFSSRNIKMNVIGINLCNTKYMGYSGDINM